MPIRADILTPLADVLAELYPDQASARALALSAGLKLGQIPFDAKAYNTWVFLLNEAEAQGRTQALLDRAAAQYASYEPLVTAGQAYADWVAAGRPMAEPVYAPRKPLRAPPPPDTFAGRTAELQDLTEVLLRSQTAAISAAVPGMGGVGKTTLALKLASDLAPHFPAGVVWLEAGFGASQPDLVDRLAHTLGIDLAQEPLIETRAAIVQSVLTSRGRVFVILDDLWDIDLGRWAGKALLPADRVLLVTSRDVALCRALCNHVQRLDVLPEAEALELLTNLLGPLGRHEDAAKTLVKLLDGHPLALEIAARRCDNGVADLPWVVRRLRSGPTLGELKLPGQESRESSVEASLTLSYGDLDLDLRQRFRALGVFAPAPFDLAGLAAVWGVESVEEAEDMARLLVRRALLAQEPADAGPIYRQHMLLRAYAQAWLEQAGELDAAAGRHVAHYQALPGRRAENWQAAEAFWEQIATGWQHAWRAGPEIASGYYDAVSFLLYRRARHTAHIEWAGELLPLRRQVGDKAGEATILNNIGLVYSDLGDKSRALELYEQALPLRRQVGDKAGEATTLNNIGLVYSALGDKPRALELYEQALPLRRQVGDKAGEATTLINMGLIYSALGKKQQALAYYQQALPILRRVCDKAGEATVLTNIGNVYSALRDKQQALVLHKQALLLRRQVGDRAGEAQTLNNMGSVYHDLGQEQQALACYEDALPIFHQVSSLVGGATALNNMAHIYFQQGQPDQAVHMLRDAASVFHQIGAVAEEAALLLNLAVVLHQALGQTKEAIASVTQSIAILERYHLPQDAGGVTLAQHQAFLVQLRGSTNTPASQGAAT